MYQVLDQSIAQKIARLFIDIKAVTFRFNPPYTYTSGIKSPIYLDNRVILSYPQARNKIVKYYLIAIKSIKVKPKFNWISATATAAIPQGTLIADRLNLPLIYVRPTTKAYGKGNKIEGYLKKGSQVIIIEDHISTATSVANNAQTVRDAGGKVNYCITTTTYETRLSLNNFAANKINLISLTTGKIIVQTAFKLKQITLKQRQSINIWFSNPSGWASKMGYA